MKKVSVREARGYVTRLLEQVSSGKLSLRDAKANLSKMIEHLDDGEEIIITRDGEPIAKLIPLLD